MAGIQNKEILNSLVELFDMLDKKIKQTNDSMGKLEKAIKDVNNSGSGADAKILVENTQKLNTEITKLTELEKSQLKIKQQIETANAKLIAAQSEEGKQLAKLNEQTIIQNKQNKLAAQELLGQVGAYKKLAIELNNARNKYKDLAASEQEATKEGRALLAQITQMDAKIKRIDASVGQFQRNVGNYGSAFRKLGKDLISNLGLVGGMTALVAVMKDAFVTIKNFQNEVAKLSAITGASGKDLEKLKDNAKEMSAQFGISATEIVKAYTVIGSQLPELLKNADALAYVTDKVLVLSQATGMDLTQSAQSVASVLNQFGLSAEYAGKVINALAAGSLEGSAEVNDISEALKNFGTVAKDSNLTVEQSIALLEVLAEKQLKGAEAGTKARGALLKLKEAGLGYQSGIFNLNDATAEYNNNLDKLGTELEKDAYAQKIFGTENITVGKIITQNTVKFNELTKKVTDTNVAYEQQRKIMNTLQGDINRTKSAWENFILTFSDSDGIFTRVLRSLAQGLNGIIDNLSTINTSSTSWTEKWLSILDIMGKIIPGLSHIARKLRDEFDITPKIVIPESEIEAAKLRGIKAAQDLYNADKILKEKQKQEQLQREYEINQKRKSTTQTTKTVDKKEVSFKLDNDRLANDLTANKSANDEFMKDLEETSKFELDLQEATLAEKENLQDSYNKNAQQLELEHQERMKAIITDAAISTGEQIGELLAKGQLSFKEFGKIILSTALEIGQRQLLIIGAEILGREIAKKSFFGIASSAILIATITAAFAGVKAKVQSFAKGTEYLTGDKNGQTGGTIIEAHEGERIVPANVNRLLLGVPNNKLPELVSSGLNTKKIEQLLEENKEYTSMMAFFLSNAETNGIDAQGMRYTKKWRTGGVKKHIINDD